MSQELMPLVWLVVVLTVAVGLGMGIERLTRARGDRALAVAIGILAIGWLVDVQLAWIGMWEAGQFVVVAAIAAWGARARWSAGQVVLLGVGLVLGGLLAEGVTRTAIGSPPYVGPQERPPWVLLDATGAHLEGDAGWRVCEMVFGDAALARVAAEKRPVTVHIGDSMTKGVGIDPDATVVRQLDGLDPTHHHVALALPGVSSDVEARIAHRVLAQGGLDGLLIHVFGGNDVQEIGRGIACCPQGLVDGLTGARHCEEPVVFSGVRRALYLSRPPSLIHAWTPWSDAARWVAAYLYTAGREWGWFVTDDMTGQRVQTVLSLLKGVQEDAASRGVRFAVVYWPHQHARPRGDDSSTQEDRMLHEALVASDLPLIDATPFVIAQHDAPEGLHLSDNVHWNAPAHAAFARWLKPRLDALWGS